MNIFNEPKPSTSNLSQYENSINSSGLPSVATKICKNLILPLEYQEQEGDLKINGDEVLLHGEGQQTFIKTTNSFLVLRARNTMEPPTNATGVIADGGRPPKPFELSAGYSSVSVPLKIANFHTNILTITNTSNAEIAVRLNGQTCDGKRLENAELSILAPNEIATCGCDPSGTTRKLSLTTCDNSVGVLIIYGIKNHNSPFMLGLNCDLSKNNNGKSLKEKWDTFTEKRGYSKGNCGYLSDWDYDLAVPDNGTTLDVQKFAIVTVINISPLSSGKISVRLYNTSMQDKVIPDVIPDVIPV